MKSRAEIKRNLAHAEKMVSVAMSHANWELPIKLVAFPEATFDGFIPEGYVHGSSLISHEDYARDVAVEIPGEETDRIGETAKQWNTYIVGQMKAFDREIVKDRFFNTAFLIDPKGKVILKHHKLQVCMAELSITPHDVWDLYVKKRGSDLDAFFEVADTEIGRIGLTVCMEGTFPEIYRGLAVNGAEIIYRPNYPEPWVSQGWFEIQNRARALDNCCYLICPNTGPCYDGASEGIYEPIGYSTCGGNSMLVDYNGQIISRTTYSGESWACAKINVEELREYRSRSMFGNSIPMLRTEYYRPIYERPVYPKNLCIETGKPGRAGCEERLQDVIRQLQKKGTYVTPV